jgi:Zn-dependent protease
MNGMSDAGASPTLAHTCPACGTSFPLRVLSCPRCQRLIHAERLKELSRLAAAHATAAEREAELTTWRSALELLPPGTRQHAQVAARIEALVAMGPEPTAKKPGAKWGGKVVALSGLALLAWKFKWALAFVLTKGKLLLLGLTKMSTLLSMLLSAGVYWSLWGWKLAFGLVLSIYVHEMGHVAALRRLGIAASAPMFVPGLGAFVRGKQYPATPAEDAEVGLAGPVWGLGAALACYGASIMWDAPFFAALARLGAWINLFNLLPVWGLDGAHGFRALSKQQRVIACLVILGAWLLSGEGLLLLVLLGAVVQVFTGSAPAQPHTRTLVTYAALISALAWLTTLPVPGAPVPQPAVALLR